MTAESSHGDQSDKVLSSLAQARRTRESRKAARQVGELKGVDAYSIEIAVESLRQYLQSPDPGVHGLAWDALLDIKQTVDSLKTDFNWRHEEPEPEQIVE